MLSHFLYGLVTTEKHPHPLTLAPSCFSIGIVIGDLNVLWSKAAVCNIYEIFFVFYHIFVKTHNVVTVQYEAICEKV